MLFIGSFDVIKVLSGYSINFAGLGYVVDKLCQFDYTQFAVDEFFLGGHDFILLQLLLVVLSGGI